MRTSLLWPLLLRPEAVARDFERRDGAIHRSVRWPGPGRLCGRAHRASFSPCPTRSAAAAAGEPAGGRAHTLQGGLDEGPGEGVSPKRVLDGVRVPQQPAADPRRVGGVVRRARCRDVLQLVLQHRLQRGSAGADHRLELAHGARGAAEARWPGLAARALSPPLLRAPSPTGGPGAQPVSVQVPERRER